MLCIQEELGNLSVKDTEQAKESTLGNGKLDSGVLQPSGWIEGLLGCLKPMWTIIGKGNNYDHKSFQGNIQNMLRIPSVFNHFD